MRHQPPDGKTELQWMTELVFLLSGNLSAIARTIGCSRQFASRRLAALGLADTAAAARAAGAVTGQRVSVSATAAERRGRAAAVRAAAAERGRDLLRALAIHQTDEAAMAALGMPRRSYYRAKATHGVDQDAADRERQRLARARDELGARLRAEDAAERARIIGAIGECGSRERTRTRLGMSAPAFARVMARHRIDPAILSRRRRRAADVTPQ